MGDESLASDPRGDQAGMAIGDMQRLWAPWRSGYVTGDDPVKGCPFCVLPARGSERDRASLIVTRGEAAYVIFNAYPYNPGHLMVVPYAHVASLDELDDATRYEIVDLTTQCVAVVTEHLSAEGVNVGMNLGAAAGAGIADHLHQHIVPRWSGDTNFMSVVGATRVLPRALEATYDAVVEGFV